jgi:glycosyltransferase involved in cell wall biosynthesis
MLDARLVEFDLELPGWQRYPLATWKTLATLIAEKPKIIFAQNPSIVLAWVAVIYANLTGKKVIIDAHNAGLFPAEGKYRSLNWLASKLFKWTTMTIVSNDALKTHVERLGGRAVSLPDPIPEITPPADSPHLAGKFNVLFICSWADDEPYYEVIRAAALLDKNIYIYMTGKSRGLEANAGIPVPGNVVLTGFVTDERFSELLYGCDAVMALTTREDCLLCGAYEGVSAGKPLLLSDTNALRNYFNQGSVYVDNSPAGIAAAITTIAESHASLTREIQEMHKQRDIELAGLTENLEQALLAL